MSTVRSGFNERLKRVSKGMERVREEEARATKAKIDDLLSRIDPSKPEDISEYGEAVASQMMRSSKKKFSPKLSL